MGNGIGRYIHQIKKKLKIKLKPKKMGPVNVFWDT